MDLFEFDVFAIVVVEDLLVGLALVDNRYTTARSCSAGSFLFCLLQALLEPLQLLRQYEDNGQGFEKLALLEEMKSLPFGAVYDYFNLQHNVPVGEEFIAKVQDYEKTVTSKRL